MKLSVVIVNYNVQYFLEQCLLSVEKAMRGIETEVFVVDNNSVDGSVQMVQKKFPWVKLIVNKDNPGFSKANNQAAKLSTGEYLLLLNPDTVVQEDTFQQVVKFMDEHPDAGGLGVKMVDGMGNFLPESKRGLPTPATSFYKITGINRIFSESKKFNRYYLGHLSNDAIHEIEILSGAFMLMRKSALDKVGLLDEAFFMYGEDIDLSWRIIQGGWKNYYYPHTSIIHYKGESTKKGSLNYVFVFYSAMVIFAKKHFSEKNAKLFSLLINVAIWLRASLAIINRFIKLALLPVADAAFTFGAWWITLLVYADIQKKIYDHRLLAIAYTICIGLWILAVWLGSGYDKPLKPRRVLRPLLITSSFIFIVYSFLPETLRFSRALLLSGACISLFIFFVNRIVANLLVLGHTGLSDFATGKIAIVGSAAEVIRVKNIAQQAMLHFSDVITVDPQSTTGEKGGELLNEIVRVHKVNQVLFCAQDLSSADIIRLMSHLNNATLDFKIAPPESHYIIGSGSIEKSGDAFMLDVNSVNKPGNQRIRIFVSMLLLSLVTLMLPVLVFIVKNPAGLFKNLRAVLTGKKAWVGLHPASTKNNAFQNMKNGVLSPADLYRGIKLNEEQIEKLNLLYAKDYQVKNDLVIFFRNLRHLDVQ